MEWDWFDSPAQFDLDFLELMNCFQIDCRKSIGNQLINEIQKSNLANQSGKFHAATSFSFNLNLNQINWNWIDYRNQLN